GPLENSQDIPVKQSNFRVSTEADLEREIIAIGQDVYGKAFITLGVHGDKVQGRRLGVAVAAKDGRALKVSGGNSFPYADTGIDPETFLVDAPLTNVDH